MRETIKQRIIRVMEYKGLNANSASPILGIPQRTLNRQINEDAKVGMELVSAILNNFGDISPAWLMLGEGDMLLDAGQPCCQRISLLFTMTFLCRQVLRMLLTLRQRDLRGISRYHSGVRSSIFRFRVPLWNPRFIRET